MKIYTNRAIASSKKTYLGINTYLQPSLKEQRELPIQQLEINVDSPPHVDQHVPGVHATTLVTFGCAVSEPLAAALTSKSKSSNLGIGFSSFHLLSLITYFELQFSHLLFGNK